VEIGPSKSNPYQRFVFSELQIPKNLVFSARALYYQSIGQHENALNNWKAADNFSQAHDILFRHIIPLYLIAP
jgi:hypothetical protein